MILNTVLLNGFFQQVWEWLNGWDTYLFLKLNTVFTNPVFDSMMPWWRDANTWTPLYIFFILFAVLNFRSKAFFWILGAVLTLVLTDQISSSIFKKYFERPRPCNDPILMSHVRLLLRNCAGGYSFTSSHATNHFGFAVYILVTLKSLIKKWGNLLLLWAASISYAQVYVGVHYPLDIFCGALMGVGIGLFTSNIFYRWKGPITLEL